MLVIQFLEWQCWSIWSVYHFSLDGNILTTTAWIIMKFCTEMCGLHRMNPA